MGGMGMGGMGMQRATVNPTGGVAAESLFIMPDAPRAAATAYSQSATAEDEKVGARRARPLRFASARASSCSGSEGARSLTLCKRPFRRQCDSWRQGGSVRVPARDSR